jgi:hypothetical protein
MKLIDFLREFNDPSTIVSRMRTMGVLRMNIRCEVCEEFMTDGKDRGRDGIIFKCTKRSCRCSKSVRTGSFFADARLSLCNCMLFLHLWCKGYTEKLICDDFEFSKNTVVDWSRFCRELCVNHFERDLTVSEVPGQS